MLADALLRNDRRPTLTRHTDQQLQLSNVLIKLDGVWAKKFIEAFT